MQVETAAPETSAQADAQPAGGEAGEATKPVSEEEAAKNKEKEKEEAAFQKRILTIPEAEIFIQLLVTIFVLDHKALEASIACASSLIQRAQAFNRRFDSDLNKF